MDNMLPLPSTVQRYNQNTPDRATAILVFDVIWSGDWAAEPQYPPSCPQAQSAVNQDMSSHFSAVKELVFSSAEVHMKLLRRRVLIYVFSFSGWGGGDFLCL